MFTPISDYIPKTVSEKWFVFVKSLTPLEACVFSCDLSTRRYSNTAIIEKCWDSPVTSSRVAQTRQSIMMKFYKYVMEYSDKDISALFDPKKDKTKNANAGLKIR